MFDMINIFEVFLPQLLRYPNPTDPLNGEAAALMMRDSKTYEAKVKGESPLFNGWMNDCSITPYLQNTSQDMQPRMRQMKLGMTVNQKMK